MVNVRSLLSSLPCFPAAEESESDAEKPPKTVNIFLGFFFMVNFVLGTGFLGIPYAFYHTGIVAGAVTLVVISFISWNCAIWELEVMARAQAIVDKRQDETENHKVTESMRLTDSNLHAPEPDAPKPNFRILLTRKFEPSELCEIFGGRWLKYIYLIGLSCYTFLACLSYATVAGSAWAVNIPFNFTNLKECTEDNFTGVSLPGGTCLSAYWLCLFFFACIVLPLSLVELREQVCVQVLLGLLRFFTLACIIVYCFVNLIISYPLPQCPGNETSGYNRCNTTEGAFFNFNYKGWIVGIPVFVYAHILHQGIPALTHPVKQKKYLRTYFNVLFITIGVLYLTLGIVVSLWFNKEISETCTLNWDNTTHPHNPTALRVLSYYIILFPSLDVCSVYPLLVLTIVNNLYRVVFGRDTSQDHSWRAFFIRLAMKSVVVLLPIAVAFGVSNLVQVLAYAGLMGFFICFFFPTLLQLRSQWVCQKTFEEALLSTPSSSVQAKDTTALLPGFTSSNRLASFMCRSLCYHTPYSTIFSYPVAVMIFGVLGIACFFLTIGSLFIHHVT